MSSKPLILILLPAAALLSFNCGILTLPVSGPSALAKNAHQLDFNVEVTDPDGNPLNDVTAEIVRYSVRVDPIFSQLGEHQRETRTINGTLRYSGFGKYAVSMNFAKPGYEPINVLFADKPNPHIVPPFVISMRPVRFDSIVDIDQHPNNRVILKPASK